MSKTDWRDVICMKDWNCVWPELILWVIVVSSSHFRKKLWNITSPFLCHKLLIPPRINISRISHLLAMKPDLSSLNVVSSRRQTHNHSNLSIIWERNNTKFLLEGLRWLLQAIDMISVFFNYAEKLSILLKVMYWRHILQTIYREGQVYTLLCLSSYLRFSRM